MPPKKRTKMGGGATEPSPCDPVRPMEGSRTSLLGMPNEIVLHIISFYPTFSTWQVWHSDFSGAPILENKYRVRFTALRALSRTCGLLRAILLPMAWELLDVCTIPEGVNEKSFYKHIGDQMERKCDGLMKCTWLQPHVKKVVAVLTRYQTKTILSKFARLLSVLSELDYLYIYHAHSAMSSALADGFANHKFPRIGTVVLPGHAFNILKCCTKVRTVMHTGQGEVTKIITGIIGAGGQRLEEIQNLLLDDGIVKRLVKAAPNIRIFGADASNDFKSLDLGVFRSLTTIELHVWADSKGKLPSELLAYGPSIKALKASSAKGPKKLRVLYHPTERLGSSKRVDKLEPRIVEEVV